MLDRRSFLALAGMAALGGCSIGGSYAPTTSTPFEAASQADMVRAVNAVRAANGRKPLAFNPALALAAQKHAGMMASRDALSHQFGPGLSLRERVDAVGYHGPVGENVAAGQRTLEGVIAGWMNSAGHRSTLLSEMWTSFGMAVAGGRTGSKYGVYWAADFGV